MAGGADKRLTVLVTGFEPFAGSGLNPSALIVDALAQLLVSDETFELHAAVLPVDSERAVPVLRLLWERLDPDLVLHFGESARAEHFTLERVAVNLLDFDKPDNAGRLIQDKPIDPAGPAARFATLPVRLLRDRLLEAGVRSVLSLSAGAYLCNQVLYESLGQAERLGGRSVGFVHVPSLPEQVAAGQREQPSMPGDKQVEVARRLVRLAVRAYLEPA